MKRILKTLLPICLLIIVATVVLYYWNDYLTEKRITEANRIFGVNTDYGDTSPEEDEEWIDWQEGDWEEQEYQPEIRPFSFDFLWDDPQDDPDSIHAALAYAPKLAFTVMGFVLGDIVNQGQYDREEKGKKAYYSIVKYIYDFRAKADLPSITEAYIDLLPVYLSRQKYIERGISQVVDELLSAYYATYDPRDPLYGFSAIYNSMLTNEDIKIEDETRDEEYARYYNFIAEYTNAEYYLDVFKSTYITGREGDENYEEVVEINYGRLIWAYSFWGRRYAEGIHQDVHYILKRIHDLYEQCKEVEHEEEEE